MSDKRTGWLADLKPGDAVMVQRMFGYSPMVGRVVKVTPTGMIDVHHGPSGMWSAATRRFQQDGREHASGRDRMCIYPAAIAAMSPPKGDEVKS